MFASNIPESIKSKIEINNEGCWNWKKGTVCGYPAIYPGKGEPWEYGHRWMYLKIHGKTLTKNDIVCHSCDNRKCLNPDHLKLGSRATNNRHRVIAKRGPWDKVTPEHAEKAREMYESGLYSQKAIGAMIGCTQQNVSAIIRGITWDPKYTEEWMLS